jgi:hypothetical protein
LIAQTPRPEEGAISWNINTTCNYRCSYCTQRFMDDRGRWTRDTPRFLDAFGRLPGRWEIKISGGEPFVHPTLDEITAGLAALGHRISIVTNFSSSDARLESFIAAARGRIGVFSCSLHLEYVEDVDAYIARASRTRGQLAGSADPSLPAPSLNVTSVATRAFLPRLPEIAARFAAAGVTFRIQPEKQDGDVIDYTEDERSQIVELGARVAHRYAGRPCWAGARYFVLDDLGRAFRCYPSRRRKLEPLGDFLSPAFALFEEPRPCLYQTCTCTVPIARKMMVTS